MSGGENTRPCVKSGCGIGPGGDETSMGLVQFQSVRRGSQIRSLTVLVQQIPEEIGPNLLGLRNSACGNKPSNGLRIHIHNSEAEDDVVLIHFQKFWSSYTQPLGKTEDFRLMQKCMIMSACGNFEEGMTYPDGESQDWSSGHVVINQLARVARRLQRWLIILVTISA
ncbi:hypothetical protein BC826DRAFT_1179741 [Russula brevipes]|nr:hypothetical protein BC826DRAFT_1179741 [Russula brevipes]